MMLDNQGIIKLYCMEYGWIKNAEFNHNSCVQHFELANFRELFDAIAMQHELH